MIGVFAGSITDVKVLLSNLKVVKSCTFGKSIITNTVLNNKNILVCGTGHGKANIAACFGNVLNSCPLKTIICCGNCGALNNNMTNLNSIAISTSTTQFDVNFSAIGYPSPLIPGLNIANYPSDDNLIKLSQIASHLRNVNYTDGLFASGDQFISNNTLSRSIAENYNAQFVDNESGVLGELCCINNIPFVSVKGISNYANENAAEDYRNNKKKSNCISNEIVSTILNLITRSSC